MAFAQWMLDLAQNPTFPEHPSTRGGGTGLLTVRSEVTTRRLYVANTFVAFWVAVRDDNTFDFVAMGADMGTGMGTGWGRVRKDVARALKSTKPHVARSATFAGGCVAQDHTDADRTPPAWMADVVHRITINDVTNPDGFVDVPIDLKDDDDIDIDDGDD